MAERRVCRKCGGDGADGFPLVAFRTMTLRSGGKIRKYQAMGEVLSVDLCPACIDAWTAERSEPRHQIIRAMKFPVLLAVLAVVIHFLGQNDILRWALCALFSGFAVAIAVTEYCRIRREVSDIRAVRGNFSRNHMIEELAASLLPRKHEDAHLSYVLRSRVMDEKQHQQISREYGLSRKKLASVRNYLLVTPESEVNNYLKTAEAAKADSKKNRKKHSPA